MNFLIQSVLSDESKPLKFGPIAFSLKLLKWEQFCSKKGTTNSNLIRRSRNIPSPKFISHFGEQAENISSSMESKVGRELHAE